MTYENGKKNIDNRIIPFPTDVDLHKAGYSPIDFSVSPDTSRILTEEGHPFPNHNEIISAGYVPITEILKAGYVPVSRRERRILSRPRVGQMYWIDFPHDAYAPEFVNEHPGIVIRAAQSLHDTCIILPVTSTQQKAGTHFHQLSQNPNPKGRAQGRIAYVVCDHFYTVNINRLRPLVDKGKPIYPKILSADLARIFEIVQKVLGAAFSNTHASIPKGSNNPIATTKLVGPNTLTLPKK